MIMSAGCGLCTHHVLRHHLLRHFAARRAEAGAGEVGESLRDEVGLDVAHSLPQQRHVHLHKPTRTKPISNWIWVSEYPWR